MSLSLGRPALPCALEGRAAIAGFFVAEAGIGSMPFGGLVEVAIARSSRPAGGARETTKIRRRITWDYGTLGGGFL
jgi:hypothetical protein